MSGEPEQVQPEGAQGVPGNEEGPTEGIRQPQTERATGGRNSMKPKSTGTTRGAAQPSVTAKAQRSIQIMLREADGSEHTHTIPENIALKLAWEILATSAAYSGEAWEADERFDSGKRALTWTAIKDVMALIRERAALAPERLPTLDEVRAIYARVRAELDAKQAAQQGALAPEPAKAPFQVGDWVLMLDTMKQGAVCGIAEIDPDCIFVRSGGPDDVYQIHASRLCHMVADEPAKAQGVDR
jgi:hypothetical protein